MIIEKGYYHPERGYWQAIIETDIYGETAPDLPQGAVEVPLKPSALHKMVDGEWVAPTQEEIDENEAKRIRFERDLKLSSEVDPIVTNTLRWNDLTEDQKKSWADYRRALLDIPQQDGFPHEVIWPSTPIS